MGLLIQNFFRFPSLLLFQVFKYISSTLIHPYTTVDANRNRKAKAKAYNTSITPQAAYSSCSGAVHVTDGASVQPVTIG